MKRQNSQAIPKPDKPVQLSFDIDSLLFRLTHNYDKHFLSPMFSAAKKLWLIALFSIGLIVLVNFAWWFFYGRTESLLDGQLGRRLTVMAKTGTARFSPDQIERLLSDDFDAYIKVIEVLEEIRLTDSLSEVFILDENYRYLATTSLEADSVYLLAPLNRQYIDSLFFAADQGALATESYRTGDIYLKSAFSSLFDTSGFAVAVLGVEASVDYFDSLGKLKNNLYLSGFLSILAGIVFGTVFLFFQRSLNRAEARLVLTETHAHLGKMVAVISHEIKNPLTIIRGSAEQVKRILSKQKEVPRADEMSQEADFVMEEVDRLNQIVTGYLNFARGTTGGLLVGSLSEQVNVDEFIAKMKMHLQEKYADQKIQWVAADQTEDQIISTYPRVLRQLILNLLINGAEACVAAKKPLKLGIAINDRGESIEIAVSDYGTGISKRERKKLFTPFYSTRQTGSGLGLFLSKKIVEEMGGRLDIDSRLGEKTEVIICLPKRPTK